MFFCLWAYVYTTIENTDDYRPLYVNCISKCLSSESVLRNNFSTKILRETLIFNYFFGIIIGVFLNKESVFSFKGLYADKNMKKYILRMIILVLISSILLLIKFPRI